MKKNHHRTIVLAILLFIAAADGAAWFRLFGGTPAGHASMHFLDVGQGDGAFVEFAGGARIMTDAGPDAKVLDSLDRALGASPHAIDLAIVSHPQLDHFNGYNFMLDAGYRIGAFVINGRDDDPGVKQWPELLEKIKAKHIPLITLGAGDAIRYGLNRIDMLSPDQQFAGSAELNDTGFVEKIHTPGMSILLTADTGTNIEDHLLAQYGAAALAVDVLKVGHHGSKYSSGLPFLEAVHPSFAVISVGAHNTYGHPAPATVARFKQAGIPVLRTDQRGSVTIWRAADGALKASTEK